ncbi:hypothetical protein GGI12_000443 [Dipsacomyces acuminosporus]|nr:hypothetical protein GGI12_000443 [Dipsacomyces acuminosporus]
MEFPKRSSISYQPHIRRRRSSVTSNTSSVADSQPSSPVLASSSTSFSLDSAVDYTYVCQTCGFGTNLLSVYMPHASDPCNQDPAIPSAKSKLTLSVDCNSADLTSKARLAIAGGYTQCPQTLEVVLTGTPIEKINLVEKLNDAGVGDAVWPCIKKLHFTNEPRHDSARKTHDFKGTIAAAKTFIDYLAKHLPSVRDIGFVDHLDTVFGERDYVYLSEFVSGLFKRYVANLDNVLLFIPTTEVTSYFWFPKQLTHLTLSMDGHENAMVPKIFAPSLQYLSMYETSPDITWNWFDSGSSGTDTWFSSLKELHIAFTIYKVFQTTYHNGDLSNVDVDAFGSSYHASARRVYFPALETLDIKNYKFSDGSFYNLFRTCPLKKVNIATPLDAKHHIPSWMFGSAKDVHVQLKYDYSGLYDGEYHGNPMDLERAACESSLAHILSTPSAARSAVLHTMCFQSISLPDKIAWSSIQRLELHFGISIKSIYNVIAYTHKLRRLSFFLCPDYVAHSSDNLHIDLMRRYQDSDLNNTDLEDIAINVYGVDQSMLSILSHCLCYMLPLVSSLKTLRVTRGLAKQAKNVVLDRSNPFMAPLRKLEIVET